jgi:hypothetical protein
LTYILFMEPVLVPYMDRVGYRATIFPVSKALGCLMHLQGRDLKKRLCSSIAI